MTSAVQKLNEGDKEEDPFEVVNDKEILLMTWLQLQLIILLALLNTLLNICGVQNTLCN